MGTHKRYKGVSLNVFDAPTEQFANALKGHDVVIWYPPGHPPIIPLQDPFVRQTRLSRLQEGLLNSFRRGARFIWVVKLADGSTFGPHTGHVVTYVPFVEGMRKIVLAVKAAVVPYFIMIGGTGSTILESEGVNCCDSRNFWVKVASHFLIPRMHLHGV
jgi:hypothetical protein